MRTPLLVSSLISVCALFSIVGDATAQVSCQPGLLATVLPINPLPGETIFVRLQNFGFTTYQIPDDCLIRSVHPTSCAQPAIFTASCNPGPFTLGTGSIFIGAWDQRDDQGVLVAPGTYEFTIPIVGQPDCCVPVTIGPCPNPTPFGNSGAGTGSFLPTLTGPAPAQVGQPLTLDIQNGLGGAQSLLLIGFTPTDMEVPFGNLYVDVGLPFLQLALPLQGASGAPGEGALSLNAAIPNDPTLASLRLYLQVLILDTGSDGWISHTPGVELYICP